MNTLDLTPEQKKDLKDYVETQAQRSLWALFRWILAIFGVTAIATGVVAYQSAMKEIPHIVTDTIGSNIVTGVMTKTMDEIVSTREQLAIGRQKLADANNMGRQVAEAVQELGITSQEKIATLRLLLRIVEGSEMKNELMALAKVHSVLHTETVVMSETEPGTCIGTMNNFTPKPESSYLLLAKHDQSAGNGTVFWLLDCFLQTKDNRQVTNVECLSVWFGGQMSGQRGGVLTSGQQDAGIRPVPYFDTLENKMKFRGVHSGKVSVLILACGP